MFVFLQKSNFLQLIKKPEILKNPIAKLSIVVDDLKKDSIIEPKFKLNKSLKNKLIQWSLSSTSKNLSIVKFF
jgi:hypothetical protein